MQSASSVHTLRIIMFWTVVSVACVAAARQPLNYNNTGVEAYKAGRYEEAIAHFEQAYDMAPESPVVRRNLCNAYQSHANALAREGAFRAAIPYLEGAVRVDPHNASPLIQLGSYYLRMDDVNAAILHLEEAIQLKPGDLDAHDLLGQAYYMDNDLSSARAQWEYVLEMDPGRNNLAERYEKAFREESVEYDFSRWKSRHFRISYPPDVPQRLRSNVFSILDRAYIDIGRKFGGVFPPPPIHVILYTADQFAEATQLEGHIGAVYDGKIRSPLTDADGTWLPEDELQRRLVHEYVHVVVRHIGGANVPWWLNEGLAETLSKPLGDNDAERLRVMYENGAAFSLTELEANQINALPPDMLRLAYVQSHATVDFLWRRYGSSRVKGFLQALGNGMSPEQAFSATYRGGYATLERDVAAQYR